MTSLEKYDFLYVDYERVCSILTAINDVGYLNSVSETKSKSISQGANLEASIPTLAKGGTKSSGTNQESKTVEYGIYWHNIYKFIKCYSSLMDKDVNKGLNKITYSEGSLTVYDVNDFSKAMGDGIADGHQEEKEDVNFRAVKHFLTVIVGSLSSKGNNYWFTLNQEHLKTSMLELTLKYGLSIGNGWRAFYIIDTIPQKENNKHTRFLGTEKNGEFETGIVETVIELRKAIGKPTGFIGVTPLLIFRKLDDVD